MKPTLEPAGNLLVPVDDSGTAVGRPEDLPPDLADIVRRLDIADAALTAGRRVRALEHALERLHDEARRYRDHGHGREHLTNALIDARRVLDGGAL